MTENVEALSLDISVNNYHNCDSEPANISPSKFSRSKSNLDQVSVIPQTY